MSKLKVYTYTVPVLRKQLFSNFFANKAIYGVKDSWGLLIKTSETNVQNEPHFGERRIILRPQTMIIALLAQDTIMMSTTTMIMKVWILSSAANPTKDTVDILISWWDVLWAFWTNNLVFKFEIRFIGEACNRRKFLIEWWFIIWIFQQDLLAEKVKEGSDVTKQLAQSESNKEQLEEQLKQEKTTAAALRHQLADKDSKETEQVGE